MSARACLPTVALAVLVTSAIAPSPAGAGAEPNPDELARAFAAAPPEYGPVPIWWWSGDKLERERLYWQLERFAEGHIYNLIVLNLAPSGALYGSDADDPPFFSEEWWAIFKDVLDLAKQLGIRIWFYDQIGFSGASLQAKLVTQHPEFRAQTLQVHEIDAEQPGDVTWTLPHEARFLAVRTAIPAAKTASPAEARWVWTPGQETATGRVFFRRAFDLPAAPRIATIWLTADNGYILNVNGIEFGRDGGRDESHWSRAEAYPIQQVLQAGRNVIAVEAENLGGPAGLLLELDCRFDAADPLRVVSDAEFRTTAREHRGWEKPLFEAGEDWVAARELGPVGTPPWGEQVAGFPGLAPRAEFARFEAETEFRHTRPAGDPAGAGGTVRVKVKEPGSRVLVFYATPGTFDYLNPQAAAALLDFVHGEFTRRVPEHLGTTLAGSFQDELPMMPRWSEDVLQAIGRRDAYRNYMYRVNEYLPHLFYTIDADTERIRLDYWDLLTELSETAFFSPMYDWHDRYGIYCGYDQVARSADPVQGQEWYLDYFRTQRWYGAPGNDMDGRTRPHSSIANLYGRPRVWMEGFHSSGWGQSIEEIAHLLHAFYREGSNLYNPHAVYYSTRGAWWEWAPPSTCWRQPYWRHQAIFSDYVARLSYLLSQGTHVADAAVVYPSRSVQAHLSLRGPDATARQIRAVYWGLVDALEAANRDFDVVDEDSLARAEVTPDGVKIGAQLFPVVLLPNVTHLRERSLELLNAAAAAGVPVCSVGEPPGGLSGAAAVADAAAGVAFVAERLPADVEGPVKSLHRRIGGLDVYFVVPDLVTRADSGSRFEIDKRDLHAETERTRRLMLSFRVGGAPESWDALTGEVRPVGHFERFDWRTMVEVDFCGAPAALVAFRADARSAQPRTVREVVARRDLGREFRCELLPTLDNRHGDLLWPPGGDGVPIEARRLLYRAEGAGEDGVRDGWPKMELAADDKSWRPVSVTFGPRALASAPFARSAENEPSAAPDRPLLFSLTDGIENDRIHGTSLGPKGHVATEFLDAGDLAAGQAVRIAAWLRSPEMEHTPARPGDVVLHVAGEADKTCRLNGAELLRDAAADRASRPVTLRAGWNHIELTLSNPTDRPLRARVTVYATRGPEADPRPAWVGAAQPADELRAVAVWNVAEYRAPAAGRLAIAHDAPVQVFVNGELSADLGRYDAYFMSRAEFVDIGRLLKPGENVVAVRMQSSDARSGFLLDAQAGTGDHVRYLVTGDAWRQVAASADWQTKPPPDGAPSLRPLRGPAHRFMGDPEALYLRRRAHPLPGAEWLESGTPVSGALAAGRTQMVPLEWAIDPQRRTVGWYQCTVPPGATHVRVVPSGGPAAGSLRAWLDGEEAAFMAHEAGVFELPLLHAERAARQLVLRLETPAGSAEGAALAAPLQFSFQPGTVAGGPGTIALGDWRGQGLAGYSGAVVYVLERDRGIEGSRERASADTATPVEGRIHKRTVLSLGKVRGTAEVVVNGRPAGVRLWHPYEFDLTDLLEDGRNELRITVTNTLGPHFAAVSPTHGVRPEQEVSGLFGPVELLTIRTNNE